MSDEISGGDRPPRRGRTALYVLAAVAVVAAGVVSLRQGVDPVALSPPATQPPVQMPAPPGRVASPLPPTPVLGLGDVCKPIRPSGSTSLAISFSLRNNSAKPVDLLAVTPRLPLAGLKERGYSIRSGPCADTNGAPLTDNRLGRAKPVEVPPAGFVVATLYFELPDECPAPYPVLTVISEQAIGSQSAIDTEYPLLSDLGGIPFPNC